MNNKKEGGNNASSAAEVYNRMHRKQPASEFEALRMLEAIGRVHSNEKLFNKVEEEGKNGIGNKGTKEKVRPRKND